MRRLLVSIVVAVSAVVLVPVPVSAAAPTWYQRGTQMTPRFEWNANGGYCGEMSFVSAGMLFGQYTSQWTVRKLANPRARQWERASWLLLGTKTERRAARAMRLATVRFDSARQRSVPQYLAWVKEHALRREAVIIGVLNNTTTLDERGPGDPLYDHIVPVFGVGSQHSLQRYRGTYFATDTLTISDNGLYSVGPNYPMLFSYAFGDFPQSRSAANAPGGPLYSLRNRPWNFATAVVGVDDPDRVTVPVRLTSSLDGEGIHDEPVMKRRPRGRQMTLTARVSIPDQARAYVVYLYDDFATVPTRDFNAQAGNAIDSWTIPAGSGPTWSVTIDAQTSDTRVFRAVPVSAP
jgi:hypothetical protein